ncbi:hypothetical protein EVAR_30727_1 [Eumeta japonica]|uniref:Uncharacterized protein n=1 Tax=Eumeta variegata TaxID=151549 RepID=A0A4C1V8V9_EUMVA|nr:hypothetical protein EVAR_30727_1 [Eumeta japonica]
MKVLRLGVDNSFSFGQHAKNIGEKALNFYGKMSRVSESSWGAQISGPKTDIQRAQRPALVLKTKAYRSTSTGALAMLAGVLPPDLEMLTGHGCYRKRLYDMCLNKRKDCDCGWIEQTRDHVLWDCSLYDEERTEMLGLDSADAGPVYFDDLIKSPQDFSAFKSLERQGSLDCRWGLDLKRCRGPSDPAFRPLPPFWWASIFDYLAIAQQLFRNASAITNIYGYSAEPYLKHAAMSHNMAGISGNQCFRPQCWSSFRSPLIITDDDNICESYWELAMAAVNRALQEEGNPPDGQQASTSCNRGHTHVCILCGCSTLRRQRDIILRENPTELHTSMVTIIEQRIAPRQLAQSDCACHPCWLRIKREVHRRNSVDAARVEVQQPDDGALLGNEPNERQGSPGNEEMDPGHEEEDPRNEEEDQGNEEEGPGNVEEFAVQNPENDTMFFAKL